MIIEFIGRSCSGKTYICKQFAQSNPKVIFVDEEWYKKSKFKKALFALLNLINPRYLYCVFIILKILSKRKVSNKTRYVRHFLFHCSIAKKAMSSKQKSILVLSESFYTLTPNIFINSFAKEEEKFLKAVRKLTKRDCLIKIFNDDFELYYKYKMKRDNPTQEKDDLYNHYLFQENNLNEFVESHKSNTKILRFCYDYTDEMLTKIIESLNRLFV